MPLSNQKNMDQPESQSQSRPRSRSSRSNSSTKGSEDWTKVSDRAERRRIQNRISQRKYREKMRMRHQSRPQPSSTTSSSSSSGSGSGSGSDSEKTKPRRISGVPMSMSMSPEENITTTTITYPSTERDLDPHLADEYEDDELTPSTSQNTVYSQYGTSLSSVETTPSLDFFPDLSPWTDSFPCDPDSGSTGPLFYEPADWQPHFSSPYTPYYFDAQGSFTWPSTSTSASTISSSSSPCSSSRPPRSTFPLGNDKCADPGEFLVPGYLVDGFVVGERSPCA